MKSECKIFIKNKELFRRKLNIEKLKIAWTIVEKAYNSLATNKDNKHLQK